MACERCDDACKLIVAGTDPCEVSKADKAAEVTRAEAARLAAAGLSGPGTFQHAAREWRACMAANGSPTHAVKVLALLTNDLFPCIGARLLAELTAPALLKPARRVEACGAPGNRLPRPEGGRRRLPLRCAAWVLRHRSHARPEGRRAPAHLRASRGHHRPGEAGRTAARD